MVADLLRFHQQSFFKPKLQNRKPIAAPKPRGFSTTTSTPTEDFEHPRTSSVPAARTRLSLTPESPPPYRNDMPPDPQPAIMGFLEKSKAPTSSVQTQTWQKVYVEITDGLLRCHPSREEVDRSKGDYLNLSQTYAYVHAKRYIRIEMLNEPSIYMFRAASETRAYHWAFVMSRYAHCKPFHQGYCKKMSGEKDILENRYLRLSEDGLLSWYKNEHADAKCKGTIQLGGEGVAINPEDKREIRVKTKGRVYIFQFLDKNESSQWYEITAWHTYRKPMPNPAVSVRNRDEED